MTKLKKIISTFSLGLIFLLGLTNVGSAETTVSAEVGFVFNTLFFLICGFLVMFMAAGFTMLESGLVRAKNTAEILTKNISLYSIATIMYMVVGYNLMYPAGGSGVVPDLSFFLSGDNATADVIKSGGEIYYSGIADHFFQVVFVATACSIISGAVAERMKLWPFLLFCVFMTSIIYPVQGYWKWGGGFLDEVGFMDFAGSGGVVTTSSVAIQGLMSIFFKCFKPSTQNHLHIVIRRRYQLHEI